MDFALTFGRDKVTLKVESEFLAGPLVGPRINQAMPGAPGEIIRQSLLTPRNRPKLRTVVENKKVGVVVSDELRLGLQEQIISCLLSEVAQGHPQEVSVFVATGSHQPEIYTKNIVGWIKKYGEELKLDYRIFPNFCHRQEDYAFLGNTTYNTPVYVQKRWLACPVRVYGHEAKYHYMNGYSCIDKQVLPGLASQESIRINHKLALHHDDAVAGKNAWHKDILRQNNPFSQDTKQVRKMSEKYLYDLEKEELREANVVTFGLDMVSQKDQVFWLECGDPDVICQEITTAVDKYLGFMVEKTKYLVVSPGGPPTCDTLYYVQNCFDLVIKGALAPGGEALVIAPCAGRPEVPAEVRGLCPDADSKKLFWDILVKYVNIPLADWRKFVNDNFEMYMWKTDRVLKLFKESGIKIYIYSQLKDEVLQQGGFVPEHNPQFWIEERARRGDGKIRLVDDGNKLCVLGK